MDSPKVTMRDLLEAGIHFGHQTRRWHPKMSRFIYGQRNGIYIIDLQKSMRQLLRAQKLVSDSVANGGHVLFVGTKKQAQEIVQEHATRCGMYYVNNRWLGGMLTNWSTIKTSIRRLVHLQELDSEGKLEQYGKKEASQLRREMDKLHSNLSGIVKMPRRPDVVFIIDAKKEHIAVREAARLNIPCIGVVDTNCDPDVVSLPIPGNDDAIRSIQLFCKVIADAAIEGRARAEKQADEEARRMEKAEADDPSEAEGRVEADIEAVTPKTETEAPAAAAEAAPAAEVAPETTPKTEAEE